MNRNPADPGFEYLDKRQALDGEFDAELDPGAYLSAHTELVDRLLEQIVEDLPMPPDLLLLATGGYGRRELCPFSDIDLLILYRGELEAPHEAWIKQLLHGLWDRGLRVGQQVWSKDQLDQGHDTTPEFLLSLLDSRFLLGERELAASVETALSPTGKPPILLSEELSQLVSARHRQFGDTLYHLEPDLKESPGGLRDVQTLGWLSRLDVLISSGNESPVESALLALNRIRIALHLEAGRNENRLSFAHQEAVAARLGCDGGSADEKAAVLMGQYFRHARRVCRLVRTALKAPVAEGPADTWEGVSDRHLLDELSGRLKAGRTSLEGALESWSAPVAEPDWLDLREPLRRLLWPRPGLYEALSELYEVGFLERLLPEFSGIRARVTRDFYHRYTVDEHTLVTLRSLEELLGPESPDPRFQTLLQEASSAELMVLALLLHDVGKGSGHDHSLEGARLARGVLGRFDFGPRDTDTVLFLVRHHLEMSEFMQKRDVQDPDELHRFATHVRDPERLSLLTLLTYADISAVAPGTLNAWKRDLLWQLYLGAHRQLTIEYGAERISEHDLRKRLGGSIARAENQAAFRAFLEGFPLRYLETTSGDEVYRHFQMALRLEPGGVESRLVQRRNHWELWVVTPDQARFFARIAGLLSYFEMNIVRARGFSNDRRIVLDSFHFEDPRGLFGRQPWEQERMQELIEGIVSDTVSVRDLLSRKEGTAAFRRPSGGASPRVRFEEGTAPNATVVEIVAPDSMGLLYRVSRIMAELGCDVELALVSTAGETACDVFYLRHAGATLSEDLKGELRRRILGALEEVAE